MPPAVARGVAPGHSVGHGHGPVEGHPKIRLGAVDAGPQAGPHDAVQPARVVAEHVGRVAAGVGGQVHQSSAAAKSLAAGVFGSQKPVGHLVIFSGEMLIRRVGVKQVKCRVEGTLNGEGRPRMTPSLEGNRDLVEQGFRLIVPANRYK